MTRCLIPAGPVVGRTRMPGSKSHSNRALIIATIATGVSQLRGVSLGDDTRRLIECLRGLGTSIVASGASVEVTGTGGQFHPCTQEFDLGLAGTSFRFLLPLCALANGQELIVTGNERMCERPMGDLIAALRKMGASVTEMASPGCAPLKVVGVDRLRGGRIQVDGRTSSQFVSALLMVAPILEEGIELEVRGPLVSESYVEMTLSSMAEFGVPVARNGDTYVVDPDSGYGPQVVDIVGDASGASYFWGLAAVTGGRVRVDNLDAQAGNERGAESVFSISDSGIGNSSIRGDLGFAEILADMGCEVRRGATEGRGWIEVAGPAQLRSVDVDLSDLPDTAQTLAVIASLAAGTTQIRGLSTLRHKETDRLTALQEQLDRVGIDSTINHDSIEVCGGIPHGSSVKTYGDHRMAMAFSVLGARVSGVEIEDPQVVTKSLPGFWKQLADLGVRSDAGQ